MKPVDYRNAIWQDIQDRLSGLRETVYEAWQQHGPCTTEELAERSGISILTLRPRTTELYQLGFVVLADQRDGHSGTYRAASIQQTMDHYQDMVRAAKDSQQYLSI